MFVMASSLDELAQPELVGKLITRLLRALDIPHKVAMALFGMRDLGNWSRMLAGRAPIDMRRFVQLPDPLQVLVYKELQIAAIERCTKEQLEVAYVALCRDAAALERLRALPTHGAVAVRAGLQPRDQWQGEGCCDADDLSSDRGRRVG